jgi:4-amino-4-deoxy-L-arabinose transferase-like glycosyltransferase
MLYVTPIVEALRGRPRLVFWIATLTQAGLWVLVPSLFYASPPGDLPLTLAIGHEWQLGSFYGPPLAYWLAELAFRVAGGSVVGVYVLAQLCVGATYWAVFTLGRATVGLAHAALAVLLMAGITAFAQPTPAFGPTVLAVPFTALALLFYWRALAGSDRSWLALGLLLGLLLLTSYFGWVLLAVMIGYAGASSDARTRLFTPYPYAGLAVALLLAAPHLYWLFASRVDLLAAGYDMGLIDAVIHWTRLVAKLAFEHAGLLVLVVVAGALFVDRKRAVPAIERGPLDPFARQFVYVFAVAPALVATAIAALRGLPAPLGGYGALIVLSGLAVIVAAGDMIRLYRQHAVSWTWAALLTGPPLLTAVTVVLLPWTVATELTVNEPAAEMGRFFSETFSRRTGRPLAIVIGDPQVGGLVALGSPQRPSLYVDASHDRAPWLSDADVLEKGAIVVWPVTDAAGTPPAHIRARLPDLVAEVPRAFERPLQGRMPLLRIGWGMIRPAR